MTQHSDEKLYDVITNPEKHGMPTFDQFAANPEAWKKTLSQEWGRIDESSKLFKNRVEKQTYKIKGYTFDTLEKCESVMKDMGINPLHCTIKPQVIPQIGGKCTIEVEFIPPRASLESILKL